MITVLIPAYNEEKILRDNVERLDKWLNEKSLDHEIIVVDNGSDDRTQEIGEDLQKTYPWFRYFRIPQRSVGKAFAKGVREAKSSTIISMDADLSTELVFIRQAESLLRDADIVVGSKTLGRQKRSFLRVLGSQLYLFVTQLLFNMTMTDFSMGAKAYRREAILPILDYIDDWTAYVFEICVWLNLNNKTMIQIGVNCVDLRKSRFNIWHEGFYRYYNLYRVWKEMKQPQSWFQQIKPS